MKRLLFPASFIFGVLAVSAVWGQLYMDAQAMEVQDGGNLKATGDGEAEGSAEYKPHQYIFTQSQPTKCAYIGHQVVVVHFRDQQVVDSIDINAANGDFVLVSKAEHDALKAKAEEKQ